MVIVDLSWSRSITQTGPDQTFKHYLVLKNSKAPPSEFVLSGIFQIDPHNFFMASDAKWNPNNSVSTHLDQVRASCLLLPVDHDTDFNFSAQQFPMIIGNLQAIENLANPQHACSTSSFIINNSNSIKITHRIFIVSTSFNLLHQLHSSTFFL